jgi:hypothetical protein
MNLAGQGAPQSDEVDRGGSTAFRHMTSLKSAPRPILTTQTPKRPPEEDSFRKTGHMETEPQGRKTDLPESVRRWQPRNLPFMRHGAPADFGGRSTVR